MIDVFNERAYKLTNRWIACYKILIYESANSWITCFRIRIYGLINRWVVCYKPIPWLLNFIILRIKHWTMSFNSSSFYLPNTQHSVSRQAHPLPLEGLGEAVTRGLVSHHIPPFPLTSPPPEGLGEAVFLWCLLFVFVNFFPSCFPIYALLRSKRRPFAM